MACILETAVFASLDFSVNEEVYRNVTARNQYRWLVWPCGLS